MSQAISIFEKRMIDIFLRNCDKQTLLVLELFPDKPV